MAKTKAGAASSSGSSSPPASTESLDGEELPCKDRVGHWPMDQLAQVWDNCPLTRERLREGHHLVMNFDNEKHIAIDQYVGKTTGALKLNHFVLSPLLKLMAENDKTLPSLDRLLQQIGYLYDRSKVNLGAKRGDRIYQDGWAIRRLCGVAKKMCYRPSPPKDPMGIYTIVYSFACGMASINLF